MLAFKIIAYTDSYIDYIDNKLSRESNVAEILNSVLSFHSFKSLPILETSYQKGLSPRKHIIGCSVPNFSLSAIEPIGLTLAKLKIQGSYRNTELFYFLPVKEHIFLSEEHILMLKACYIDQKFRIQPVEFASPILLDTSVFSYYWVNQGTDRYQLNDPRTTELASNKNKTYNFLKKHGLPTTAIQFRIYSNINVKEKLNIISANGKLPLVIKPINECGGNGVEMFAGSQLKEAIQYARRQIHKRKAVLAERRIISFPAYQNEKRMDSNVRLILTFDKKGRPAADINLTMVRWNTYSNAPINICQGAKVVSLKKFINSLKINSALKQKVLSELFAVAKSLGRALLKEIGATQKYFKSFVPAPSILGLDLILDEHLNWNIIEINEGCLGGIREMLNFSNHDPQILIPILDSLSRPNRDKRVPIKNIFPPRWG